MSNKSGDDDDDDDDDIEKWKFHLSSDSNKQ